MHDASPDSAHAKPHAKVRTVNIELWKTAERVIDTGADGSFQYGPLNDIDGVEVCVAKRRPAFAIFQPFEDLDPPICTTSEMGQPVELHAVPADSDLMLTGTKDGYQPGAYTLRTDEFDVAAPNWGSCVTTLLRRGAADPWLEQDPAAATGDGRALIWASAAWWGSTDVPPMGVFAACGALTDITPAEGVRVAIARVDGSSVTDLSTLRERPLWVSLAPGSYRMRFSHDRFHATPLGPDVVFALTGLPTDTADTIEVPVLADRTTTTVMNEHCRGTVPAQRVEDLATCTLQPLDAGSQ